MVGVNTFFLYFCRADMKKSPLLCLDILRKATAGIALSVALLTIVGCGRAKETRLGEIRQWEDLAGKNVGVTVGSVQEDYIEAHCPPGCNILHFNGLADAMEALNINKLHAVLAADINTMMLNLQNNCYHDALILGNPMPVSIGFQKGDTLFRKEFNRFLAEYKGSGEYDAMSKRWTENFKEEGRMPKMHLPTEGTPLKCAVILSVVPFQFMDENGPAGIEIEVVQRYSEWSGRPVEFVVMDFSAVIASLLTGKVDMAASMLARTEERASKIDFSDTMYSAYMSVIVKNREIEKTDFLTSVKKSFNNNLIEEDRYLLLLEGFKKTVLITVLSLLLGTLLGALVCGMRMSRRKVIKSTAALFITVMRGIPILVILMILFYVIFATSSLSAESVAVVAFSLNFAAYAGEIFRGALMSVDQGQYEAAYAMGFSKFKTFIIFILPQAVKLAAPVFKGEVTSLLKGTSVVGYIAIQDLTKMSDIIRNRTFDPFFPLLTVAVIYLAMSFLFNRLLDLLIQQEK